MKTFKVNRFSFLITIVTALSCASQSNLSKTLSKSRNAEWRLSYIDSSGKTYQRGLYGGVAMKVVFKNVEAIKKNNLVKVEGMTTAFFNDKDTVGLCCVNYFIARPVNGYLTKIRKLGETNTHQTGDSSKPDGYFSFEIVLDKKDRLYFIADNGDGLEEYNIGKVYSEIFTTKNKLRKSNSLAKAK